MSLVNVLGHFFPQTDFIQTFLATTNSDTGSNTTDGSQVICFYNNDPALPVYQWGLTKGMATDDIAAVLIQEKIEQSEIARKVPTNIIKNTVFVVNTTELCAGEDMRCDEMGAWLYTGSKRFGYRVDDEGNIKRETATVTKSIEVNRQFFKNKRTHRFLGI